MWGSPRLEPSILAMKNFQESIFDKKPDIFSQNFGSHFYLVRALIALFFDPKWRVDFLIVWWTKYFWNFFFTVNINNRIFFRVTQIKYFLFSRINSENNTFLTLTKITIFFNCYQKLLQYFFPNYLFFFSEKNVNTGRSPNSRLM